MRSEFLPFSRPSINAEDIDAVSQVLASGWITTGPKCAEFEERFAQSIGSPGAVALSSATGGLHLILKALNIGPGDEVITPSMTWVSTVNLIVLCGATPVFVDIDRDTLMTTAEDIAKRITPRTRLIIPVHFAGAALDLDPIRQVAQDAPGGPLPVVEDAAHAIGTAYKHRPVGQKGTTIFSFHPIKNITTGEGGMVCSDDSELLQRLRCLKFHGLGVDAHDRNTQGRAPQAEVIEPGYKYNMLDFSATLGIQQLERLEAFNQRRRQLAERYLAKLEDVALIRPLEIPAYEMTHSWHLFVVRLLTEQAGITRDEFMAALKERQIGSGIHFRAVHMQKFYRQHMGDAIGRLPHTEWNSERLVSLPLFPDMLDEDVDCVVNAIKEILA